MRPLAAMGGAGDGVIAIDWGSSSSNLPAASADMDAVNLRTPPADTRPEVVGFFNPNPNLGAASLERWGRETPDLGASGGLSSRISRVVPARQGPWRMLSAHANGQLLMWDLTAGRLQLICAIGDQGVPIV